ncbi:ribosome small subunit-dependent GTPase A [Dokdonella sp.]|jgi:ribosome biogenesis GTPase|uniref:ribosome small subunit-dependent GTPase A n=1 Tax=Dokdonella sp. TaxID=2291710 RepID=UPI001B79118B|nr:ribosome small subunit-dependent GTPase A [Dokdonella sp.]
MTETPASALSRIGWRGEIPASDSGTDHRRIARVVAQHRAGYELHDGEHAFTAQPAPRFLKPGIDPGDRPAVGDFVWISNAVPPTIEQVLPRRSTLSRSAAGERHLRQVIATNIDTVMVVCGLDGDFNPARIERYFVLIEGSGAKAVVVLTKADLAADAQALTDQLKARMPAGTEIHAINAKTGFGVDALLAHLGPGSSTVLVGSSGAGKSTLTNTLLGEARQSTQAVRANDSRGRHTTTYRSLIMLPSGGCLIDTPGMREVKLTGDESFDGGQFDDIEELAGECRFGDCSHLAEPSCAVRAALDDGRLDPERWHSYLKLRDELAAAAESLEAQLRRKSESRVLTKALGKRLDEKYGRH